MLKLSRDNLRIRGGLPTIHFVYRERDGQKETEINGGTFPLSIANFLLYRTSYSHASPTSILVFLIDTMYAMYDLVKKNTGLIRDDNPPNCIETHD